MSNAIIVLGHGSRAAEATAQFLQVVDLLKGMRPDALILPAFMELAEPSLQDAVAQAVGQGATEIVIAAYFLYDGNHIKLDIPEMIAEMTAQYPGVSMRLTRPIGPDPRIADILNTRVEEVAHV